MDWRHLSQPHLERLLARVNRQAEFHREVFEWLQRHGVPVTDPLMVETCVTWERLAAYAATIERLIRDLPRPYRPLVDPWQTRGLAAKLRPDFEARGIDGSER